MPTICGYLSCLRWVIVDNLLLNIKFPHDILSLNMYGWRLTEVLFQNKLQAQTLYIFLV